MGLDLTTFDAALKQHYTNDMVENMVYHDNPLLALMPKMKEFGGRNLPVPLIYGNPQGRSATFTQAQSRGAATSSKLKDFLLTRVHDYSIATIDNETLEASKGNANAFLEAATVEIDGAINTLTRSLAIAQYRQGFGEIGTVGVINGSTITLSNVQEITNIEIDQQHVFASAVASGALRDSGDFLTVLAVDRDNGVITYTSAVAGVTGLIVGDSIFVRGDREDSATPAMTKIAGIEAWNPYAAVTSTAFFGVDRTSDTTRLAGMRQDGSNKPIEEALLDAAARVAREGWALTHFFMTYEKYAELEKSLGSKVQYIDLKVNAEVFFRGITISGTKGVIRCLGDQNCQPNRVRGVNLNYWKHYSLGEVCRVIDTDGLQMLRQSAADGVEVRYGYYANDATRCPASNISVLV
jgi:hypothetical protein